MTIGIYKLIFKGTDKIYIGQSLNIETRYVQHLNLMKLGKSSKALNTAYIEYGIPTYEILIECNEDELDSLEDSAIEVYNSVNNGFNTCHSAGGKTKLSGELHGRSGYSNQQIYEAFKLIIYDLSKNFQDISNITGVSKSVISGIASTQQHKWLKTEYPEEYSKLEYIYSNEVRSKGTKRGTKVGSYYLVSPEGVVHLITNASQFAKEHGLHKGNLGMLKTGERKSHKGWKLCPAPI